MEVGQPHHFRWMFGIICALLILNLLDAILTLIWLTLGAATEANPIMDAALGMGPVTFVVMKTFFVCAGSFILWKRRRRPFAVIGTFLLFLIYYFILVYHLEAMNLNLITRLLQHLRSP